MNAPNSAIDQASDMGKRARRVLLGWELGDGFGHAARLLTIAVRLRELGWHPVVAARDPSALASRYAATGVAIVPAPQFSNCYAGPGPFRAATYADIMGMCGYADQSRLAAAVAVWDQIIAEHRPDVILADYAPLLSLAAFGRVPVIAIGGGFITPHGLPNGAFPALGEAVEPVWDAAELLANAQAVQAGRKLPVPDSLPQVIEGAGQVVSVPPELDIYGDTRPVPAAGPWFEPPPSSPPPAVPYVFSYLRLNHPAACMVLQVLVDYRIPGECYLHHASAENVAVLEQAGIKVHDKPPPLRQALERASFLIHHGGMGSLEEAAFAGRPQLLLPRHLEQVLNTKRALVKLPGTCALTDDASIDQLREHLPPLFRNAGVREAAQASAVQLAAQRGTAWAALAQLLAELT